jgi:uncharacterized protein YbcI
LIHRVTEEIVRAKIRYLNEHMGRGPEGYRTYVIDDMIIVRLLKVLTPAENQQATTAEGQGSIKATRMRLIHDIRPSLENLISRLTGANVISVHSDLSTKSGEAIIIVVLDRKIAHRARRPWPTPREPRVPQPYADL